MLSEKLSSELNKQVNAELYSSYLYLSMAAYFDSKNLSGFANWMKCQVQEEIVHAMKIYDYINGRGAAVTMMPIEGPKTEWSRPLEVFEDTYKHEQKVTSLINNLVTIATEENDYATQNFLQWFVAEQVEEEASADEMLQKLKLVGDKGDGIYLLDKELAQRVFVRPADQNV